MSEPAQNTAIGQSQPVQSTVAGAAAPQPLQATQPLIQPSQSPLLMAQQAQSPVQAAEPAESAEQRISSLPARAEDAAVRIKESHDKRAKLADQTLAESPATVPPSVQINNTAVLESVSHLPERMLGTQVYEPNKLLLRDYDDYWNSILEVRVARRYISQNHIPVLRRAVWGTSIYTDDSDLVAALYHEGFFDAGSKLDPNCDLLVSLRVLPPLRRYVGCTRHGINSRTWLSPHDGISYLIVNVTEIAQGTAEAPMSGRRQRMKAWSEAYAIARPASQRPSPHPAEV